MENSNQLNLLVFKGGVGGEWWRVSLEWRVR